MDDDVAKFGQTFQDFMERMTTAASAGQRSPIAEKFGRHLGVEDLSVLPIVSDAHPAYDHVNVQVALSAYLDAEGRRYELIGLTGSARHHGSMSDIFEMARHAGVRLGSVDFVNLPSGPDETLACVQFGLFLVEDRGTPLVVLMRGAQPQFGHESVSLEVLAKERERSRALLAEVRRLMIELNVFRGKVVSFAASHMGHIGLGPVVFHRRPTITRDQLILPVGVLDVIERQVLGIGEYRDWLRAGGQHVKRGVLLYGPPGNGKTLTARYLVSRLRDHTVLLLTGGALHMIGPACGLARMLQPSVVVLEDVDLVARHREADPFGNPVLFEVLNEMDGMAEDADVAFLLTSNRADLLEPALAARPGRVDTAVEIPLPDGEARARLIELYGRRLDLRLERVEQVVDRTAGVAASFVKELMRKAALEAVQDGDDSGPLILTDAHLESALDHLLEEGSGLTRVLLGGSATGVERVHQAGTDWLLRDG